MFYDKFSELCARKNVSINRACIEMGLSRSLASKWKATDAGIPTASTLQRIADYFDVSVSYLLGEEDRENYYDQLGEYDRELIDLIIRLEKTDKELLYKILEMSDEKKNAMLNMIKAM